MNKIEETLINGISAATAALKNYLDNRHKYEQGLNAIDEFIMYSSWGLGPYLYVTVNKTELTEMVKRLRMNGWEWKDDERPPEKFSSWVGKFKHPDHPSIYDEITVSFNSSVCKRVQVGTQMVEQPVYEIQCETEEVASPPF